VFFTITARHAFDASHRLDESHKGCGHRWEVTVTARQHFNASKQRLPDDDLQEALVELLTPLYNRMLNDMLPATSASPEGLASWLAEILALKFPDITEVTVAASYGKTVTYHRELRRVGGLL